MAYLQAKSEHNTERILFSEHTDPGQQVLYAIKMPMSSRNWITILIF